MKRIWFFAAGFFVLILLAAYCFQRAYSFYNFLPVFSFLMVGLFFMCWSLLIRFDVANSFFFFSIMYLGYALGGIYYVGTDGYFGKFMEFYGARSDLVEALFLESIIYALIFYFGFCFFYFIKGQFSFGAMATDQISTGNAGFDFFLIRYSKVFIYPILLGVLVYWVCVCYISAGGVVNAIIYFHMFPHFIEDVQLSIAPYLLYYSCIYIWALSIILSKKKIPLSYFLFSFLGVVIILSTARIAQAATYIFAQLVFFLLLRPRYYVNVLIFFSSIVVFGLFVHFARTASNYYYLGLNLEEMDFDLLRVIVGGGNVSDLQQLAIVIDVFSNQDFFYGTTFFDWFKNSIGQYFGFKPSSVGLFIHSIIVPEGSSSGAPTPGALGELHANFGFYSILFSLLIGIGFRCVDELGRSTVSLVKKLVYSIFITHFVFLYPKVDTTMLVNFIWAAIPFLCLLLLLFVVYFLGRVGQNILLSRGYAVGDDGGRSLAK